MWSPGRDALRLEVVGELVGPRLQLRVGAALVADHEDLAVGHRVDGVLEQVGDVVRHGSDDTSDPVSGPNSGGRGGTVTLEP